MKKMSFITLFFATQVIIVALIIYKQSKKIEFSYKKQQYEKQKENLIEKKKELTQKLYEIKSHSSIKKFAKKEKMEKVRLRNIKTVNVSELW